MTLEQAKTKLEIIKRVLKMASEDMRPAEPHWHVDFLTHAVFKIEEVQRLYAEYTPSPVAVDAKAGETTDKDCYVHQPLGKDPEFDAWEKLHDPQQYESRLLRTKLSSERAMHKAWRKRAEEAEAALTAPKPDSKPVSGEVADYSSALKYVQGWLNKCAEDKKYLSSHRAVKSWVDLALKDKAAHQPAEDEGGAVVDEVVYKLFDKIEEGLSELKNQNNRGRLNDEWANVQQCLTDVQKLRLLYAPPPAAQISGMVGERLNKVRDALRGAKSELVCLGRELNGLNKTHSHLVKTLPDDETIPMIDEALAILSAVKDKA